MRNPAANLFLRLHTWASGQDENFTSESFAYVLQHLTEHDPAVGARIVRRLTGCRLDLSPQDAEFVTITTQVSIAEGRPDIEIRTPDHLVYVEVKVEAELGEQQLERYRSALTRSGYAYTTLVLLTQYPMMFAEPECPDIAIRWFDIADWFEEEAASGRLTHPSTSFVVTQFLGFLYGRNLAMEKVGWELGPGVRSLGSLLAMMKEAIDGDRRIKRYNLYLSQDFVGYYLGAAAYYLGLYYEQPAVLRFQTWGVKISKERGSAVNIGRLWEERPVGLRWGNTLDLESEEVHFYALPKAKQMQCIERFYRQSLDIAQSIVDPI